jgi:hypothetical protein
MLNTLHFLSNSVYGLRLASQEAMGAAAVAHGVDMTFFHGKVGVGGGVRIASEEGPNYIKDVFICLFICLFISLFIMISWCQI